MLDIVAETGYQRVEKFKIICPFFHTLKLRALVKEDKDAKGMSKGVIGNDIVIFADLLNERLDLLCLNFVALGVWKF